MCRPTELKSAAAMLSGNPNEFLKDFATANASSEVEVPTTLRVKQQQPHQCSDESKTKTTNISSSSKQRYENNKNEHSNAPEQETVFLPSSPKMMTALSEDDLQLPNLSASYNESDVIDMPHHFLTQMQQQTYLHPSLVHDDNQTSSRNQIMLHLQVIEVGTPVYHFDPDELHEVQHENHLATAYHHFQRERIVNIAG